MSRRGTALVTGGARRIGAAIAQALAADGWHVVIHHLSSHDEAEALVAGIAAAGGSAEAIAFDLSTADAPCALADRVADRHSDWRLLVNSAAVFEQDAADEIDTSVWDHAMAVNLRAPVRLAQHFARAMRGAGDLRIVNLLDQKLANLNPDFFSYTVAKAGLQAAGEMMAMHFAATSGPRVFAVAPGLTLLSADQTADEFVIASRMNLLSRANRPEDVADAVRFLAHADVATGQTLFVDSGQRLTRHLRDVMFLVRDED